MRPMRVLLALTAASAFTACLPAVAAPLDADMRRSLEDDKAPYVTGELLVQYRGGATEGQKSTALKTIAGFTARPLIRESGDNDVDVVRFGALIPMKNAIERLQDDPNVETVEPNWIYTKAEKSNDRIFVDGGLWGMTGTTSAIPNKFGIGADQRWARGRVGTRDVYVGVIDEGIMVSHDDLEGNMFNNPFDRLDGKDNDGNGYKDDLRGWDFYHNDRSVFDGRGDDHGTHVAGTIGARGGNKIGVVGVNWKVKMISAKFLGPDGGNNANAIRALNYLVKLKKKHGLNIVATNNSWGGAGHSKLLLRAINRAGAADILFVAAAGNDGRNIDRGKRYFPAGYQSPYIITVAAIDVKGQLASFSNWGPDSVDIGAPGADIWSTVPRVRDGKFVSGYDSYFGTSMATPHVTGMIALMADAYPGKNALQLKQYVLSNATRTTSLVGKVRTNGRLSNGL